MTKSANRAGFESLLSDLTTTLVKLTPAEIERAAAVGTIALRQTPFDEQSLFQALRRRLAAGAGIAGPGANYGAGHWTKVQ